MSFDDYATHIYQKHRLAVALAIIKSKPSNIDTAKYLEELKSKVHDKMDDDDVTLCSDDFLMDDDDDMNDSVTILKDFDLGNIGNEEINELDIGGNEATNAKTLPGDLSQITYYDSSQTQYSPNMTSTSLTINEKDDNLNHRIDIENSIPSNMVNKNGKSNIKISTFDHNVGSDSNMNLNVVKTQETNTIVQGSNCNLANMDSTYYDSQKTILYTVHSFTDNYTHYSPSQTNIIIPNKYLNGINKNQIHTFENDEESSTHIGDTNTKMNSTQNINEFPTVQNIEISINTANTNTKMNLAQNGNDFSNEIGKKNTDANILMSKYNETPSSSVNKEFEYSQIMNIFSQRNDEHFNEIQDLNIHSNIEKDTNRNSTNTYINNVDNQPEYSQNVDEYFEEIQYVENNDCRNTNNINNGYEHNSELSERLINNGIEGFSQNTYQFSQNIDSGVYNNEFDIRNKINDSNKSIFKADENQNTQNSEINSIQNQNTEIITQNSEINSTLVNKNEFSAKNNEKREDYTIAEEEEDCETEETISYKVLEEFNKVKTFLNRQNNRRMSCDGYSTDSGYRSDSQIRCSNRSALQLSGNWINQSGCCLFNYILQCPLVASTRDITNEIAQMLSQLIDRLHDEEKYPSFLEDLLETVDLLLRQVHEGESSGDSEFLKKDESIQRIFLLSKSIHIQKHMIEKISNILETFHSKITETDSTYELSNIDQIENISYIFHILEILLKKYLKNKDLLSQSSTQPSQDEEKVFKKSSITDIWRKKWNPTQKVFEGSREKKCVLKICSDILNKIVVDCVSSYSLVAYSALKCFNSMQS